MSFLAPLLLLGLGALSVPILVHLIQRERREVVEFPSLMFLSRIPYRSMRRQKIRHWLLLLLRCAALVLLVLAFARPFFTAMPIATGALSATREVVILLDRSFSMGYGDRWERARDAARGAVSSLGPEDRATLVLFARGAEAGARSTTDRASLLAAIDASRVEDSVTRYGPALKLARGILEQSELSRREVILIGDFQRAGWEGAEADALRLPPGAVLTPVSVASAPVSNLSVTSVSFEREIFSGRERIAVSARVTNTGGDSAEDVPLTLEADGLELERELTSVAARSSATVTFAPFTLSEPWTRGIVRAEGDLLPRDDTFRFVVSPGEMVSVLILETPGASREGSLYLEQALAIGDAPGFRPERRSLDSAGPSDLDGRALVILNDVVFPGGRLGQALADFVAAGGGLLAVLGERSAWPAARADLLPGTIGAPIDRSGQRGGRLGFVDYSHPVFELFGAPRSGDLSAARFYRYRSLASVGGDAVLARFDDGAVALAERRVGQGRVLVWASTMDSFWNDLALKPVFLPFVHQLARHLAAYAEPKPWLTVGQPLDAAGQQSFVGADLTGSSEGYEDLVVLTPSGARLSLGGASSGLVELAEQGFYEIRAPGVESDRPLSVAANVDPSESDLTPLDPQELASAVTGLPPGEEAAAVAGSPDLTPEEQERRQIVWWYLLAAALLALVAETVVSNRMARAEKAFRGRAAG